MRSKARADPHRRKAGTPAAGEDCHSQHPLGTFSSVCSQGLPFADPSTEQDTLPHRWCVRPQRRESRSRMCASTRVGTDQHQTPSHCSRSQSCSRPHHEVRSRQGRPHGLGACTWQAVQVEVASVRTMLHVYVGKRQRRKGGENGLSMARGHVRCDPDDERRVGHHGARRREES